MGLRRGASEPDCAGGWLRGGVLVGVEMGAARLSSIALETP